MNTVLILEWILFTKYLIHFLVFDIQYQQVDSAEFSLRFFNLPTPSFALRLSSRGYPLTYSPVTRNGFYVVSISALL